VILLDNMGGAAMALVQTPSILCGRRLPRRVYVRDDGEDIQGDTFRSACLFAIDPGWPQAPASWSIVFTPSRAAIP
jgi:hypothetical protein